MEATQIVLAKRPMGSLSLDCFRFEKFTPPSLNPGEVRVKGLFYSVDPYLRMRMNDVKSYIPPFEVNQPIMNGAVATIVESQSPEFKTGDLVVGMMPWATESVVSTNGLQVIHSTDIPPHYFLGILGMPGLTAYFCFLDIGKPKAGETVVVSGAAGAVGLVVSQIAKIKGCKVIGIAGSEHKINMLKNEFGLDEVINYKTTQNLKEAIAKACPDGVDIYFDNVGGEISDAVMSHINQYARIAICGQISLYNETKKPIGPRREPLLLTKSALMHGFLIFDHFERFPEGISQLFEWIEEGKLHFKETIMEGFDKLPDALMGLFSGENTGKMIVKVS